DILREAVLQGTDLGTMVEPFMKNGQLVPDDLVNELVNDRFRRPDRPEDFIMDGYPRTLAQAHAFDAVLRQQHLNIDRVLLIDVPDENLVQRIIHRRVCPNCKAAYHLVNKPPLQPGVCDECGHALIHRPDDEEETVRERLRQYRNNTMGLIPYYKDQGL